MPRILTPLLVILMLGGLASCTAGSSAADVLPAASLPATSTVAAVAPASTASPPVLPAPGTCHLVDGAYPDPTCTPGAANPRVTQANIHQTICTSGWSSAERAKYFPQATSSAVKKKMMAAYGLKGSLKPWELDHRIPIEDGGDPSNPAQFFPEPWDGAHGAHVKDALENSTHAAICAGKMTLAQAQALFTDNTARHW